ncbi:MAG: methyltransferase domain-containing protein [Gemmatimonadota bacterium]
MFLPALERVAPARAPERMDARDCDPDALAAALRTLARASRSFGGTRPVWRGVRRALAGREPGPLRLLDVGTGGGDLPRRLFPRLRALGWRPELLLADLHPAALALARDWTTDWARRANGARAGGLRCAFLRTSAPCLPLADASVDLVVSTTMLHHLECEEAVAFLREVNRVARLGWVLADLRRSRLTAAAVRLLAETLWRRNPFPRVDGPVSVRRAFRPSELRDLARHAGVGPVRVGGSGPFHLFVAGGMSCRT